MKKKITLAEAVPLRNIISRRVQELLQERSSMAFVEAEKGEEYERPSRTVDEITKELEEARKDFRSLHHLLTKANLEHTIEWDGERITLIEAIELAKQIRCEIQALKSFANTKKVERIHRGFNQGVPLLKIAQFNPEQYRKLVLKLERKVNKLSTLIEHSNHFVYIEFDDTKYVEG